MGVLKRIINIFVAFFVIASFGCSGGSGSFVGTSGSPSGGLDTSSFGSSGSSSSSNTTSTTKIGYLVDSPVEGVEYVCGSKTGMTGTDGSFQYDEGASCIFKIGAVTVGSLPAMTADAIVTPYDLAQTSRSDTDNAAALQIAQFLQSLADTTTAGRIKITSAVTTSLQSSEKTSIPSASSAKINSLVTVDASKTLVTTADAKTAMQSYLTANSIDRSKGAVNSASIFDQNAAIKYDFESGVSGWSALGSGAITANSVSYEGSGSLKITSRTDKSHGPSITLTGLSADKTYIIRAWAKRSVSADDKFAMMLKVGSSDYRELTTVWANSESWVKLRAFVRLSSADIANGIKLYFNTKTTANDFYLDAIEVVPTTYTPPSSANGDFIKANGAFLYKGASKVRLKGINIIAYNDEPTSNTTTEFMNYAYYNYDKNDFKTIASWGFNSVRISLWARVFESSEYVYDEAGFAWLNNVLGWAKEAGLYVILDMHAPQGGGFQGPSNITAFWGENTAGIAYRDRYIRLWEEIARRYKNESTIAAYDLLNEPCPNTQEQYTTLMNNTIYAIRNIDSEHLINVENTFASDAAPFSMNYSNIVYDFHMYDPWGEYTNHASNTYPATSGNRTKAALKAAMDVYFNYYSSRGLPVNVSEFGQKYDTFASRGALVWVKDVLDLMDEAGVSYQYFSFKGNEFGIYSHTDNNMPMAENLNQTLVSFFVERNR